jgi:hypothetical protein
MTALTVTMVLLSLLTLAALVLAAVAFCRAAPQPAARDADPEIESLRSALDGLAAQLHSLQELPAPPQVAGPARAGLNLAKRSQALRLHRHGNSAAQIAATLEIPVQEVELLLKIQRIVLSNI